MWLVYQITTVHIGIVVFAKHYCIWIFELQLKLEKTWKDHCKGFWISRGVRVCVCVCQRDRQQTDRHRERVFHLELMWLQPSYNGFKAEFIFVLFESILASGSQKTDMGMNICSHPYVDASLWRLTAVWLSQVPLWSVMKVKSLLNNGCGEGGGLKYSSSLTGSLASEKKKKETPPISRPKSLVNKKYQIHSIPQCLMEITIVLPW